MKSETTNVRARDQQPVRRFFLLTSLILVCACLAVSCRPRNASDANRATATPAALDRLAIVLAPHAGDRRVDGDIRRYQQQVRDGKDTDLALEQLGWLFVAKARASFDSGFYTLAEQSAFCLEQRHPQSLEALFLRGHVLNSRHQFKEAEALARRGVAARGLSFDYGLLGDALMEQGKLNDAVAAYQEMINRKPDLHAYARVAHVRWLKGDLAGAIEMMQLAAGAVSPLDPEAAAWVHTRLAGYEFQAGQFPEAERRCAFALSFQTNYAPTLLLSGRILLAQKECSQAANLLQRAARLNPLPEYQWTLAEALRGAGREAEAFQVEKRVREKGAASDPRTLALFLATRGESAETALRLARAEFDVRGDVFTHDALAWSLAAAGRYPEAQAEMDRALAEGTEDGRLSFHAALIAARSGRETEARRRMAEANRLAHLLLPSERNQLRSLETERVTAASGAADY